MLEKLWQRIRRRQSSRSFAAAQLSRLTESWLATREQINNELRNDLDKLRSRARDLEKNNDFARRFLEMVETNVIGDTGARLMSLVENRPGEPDQLARGAIESGWERWERLGTCEMSGRKSFVELCWEIARGTARDGEYLVQEVVGAGAKNEFGYALRVIDVDRIATFLDRDPEPGRNAIRCGIEVDADSRPVRYWLRAGGSYSRDVTPLDAGEVLHRFRGQFSDQPRGIPWMHAAMLSMHYAGEFALSALLAAKYGADHLGFFVTPDGSTPLVGETQPDGTKITTTAPGTWDTLPVGTDVREMSSKYPSDTFDPFMRAANRRMASGLNVSYPALCNDHADLNYNSIRATQADDRDQWRKHQRWFEENWLDPLFDRWLTFSLINGALKLPNGSALPREKVEKFRSHRWQFRGWASNDPLKDVQAARASIEYGLDSRTAYAARSGRDIEDVMAELAQEKALAASMNVEIDKTKGKKTGNGFALTRSHPTGAIDPMRTTFCREARIETQRATEEESGDLVVEVAFASEQPYERWWGVEILDCSSEAVRLDRLNDGAAVLYNHNWNELRGVHEAGSVRCDEDRVVRGLVRLTAATQAGRDTIALVRTGVLTKTSVGYEIHRIVEQTTSKSGETVAREIDGRAFAAVLSRSQREAPGDLAAFRRALDAQAGALERGSDPAIYRVIDWEPLENSLVTVPADPSVGVGRQVDATSAANFPTRKKRMEDQIPVDVAAIEARAAESANKRVAELLATGEMLKNFSGVAEMVQQALRSGESVADFTKRVMEHVSKTGTRVDTSIGMSRAEAQRFSILRAVRAMAANDWSDAGFEREASRAVEAKAKASGVSRQSENGFFVPLEVQRRDLTVAAPTGGGNLVATNLRPQDFIELLRARTLAVQLGTRVIGGLVGNADITKQTGAGTAYWLANEATAITESSQTVGLLQLRPKVVGAYTEVSRLLLQQSTPDAEQFVSEDLARVLAIAIDAAILNGNGSGAPVGILNTVGIGAFTGTSLDYAALLNAQTDVADANALVPSCAYVTTPTVAALLAARQRFTSTDTPLWQGNILDGNIAGFRAASSTNMPAATMIFGDFAQTILAEWGAMEIASNPFANFPAGITGIRAFYTCDVGVRVAGAFSAASTIT